MTEITLAPQQVEALAAVDKWLEGPDQTFYLAGYAGTGKTTIAKRLKADFYMAYTGKAAYVLQEKGCPATTIHQMIYIPQNKSGHRLALLEEKLEKAQGEEEPDLGYISKLEKAIRDEKSELKRPAFLLDEFSPISEAGLVVIDECSMVGERIGADLESFGCKILVLGDPFQLPPVKSGGYFTEREPDYLLTDIHRQAEGDPILGLATHIRQQGRIDTNHECVDYDTITPEEAMGYDQIICGRNKTRHKINRRMRELLGRSSPLPEVGDKVVCLKNNHEVGLLNGALHEVTGVERREGDDAIDIQIDGYLNVCCLTAPFLGKEVDYWQARNYEQFDYGYALTCHKAQGSQWDSVLVYDESNIAREHAARWLYTAVTRAAKRLKVTA